MYRLLPTLLMALLLSQNGFAQEAEPDAASADEERAAESATENVPESEDEIDVTDLESESYADAEEEDFVPTEEIPADQAIPFPTDI
jgi:hypothetical protein